MRAKARLSLAVAAIARDAVRAPFLDPWAGPFLRAQVGGGKLITDPDLEWLLCVAPGLLGQQSGHGAIVAVLEGGGSGAFDSAAAEAVVERARPHVARARRLRAIWAELDRDSRRVLLAHYTPRSGWAPGVAAMLGPFAALALLLTEDRPRLELACCHGSLAANRALIRRERDRAERTLARAHRAWRDARDAELTGWVCG